LEFLNPFDLKGAVMARRADLDLAAAWRWRLERFERSTLSIARFCFAEGVSEASFYQWRRKLKAGGAARQPTNERSQEIRRGSSPQATFAPVRLIAGASLTAHLPGGTRLEIPLGDEVAARAAIEMLIEADAQRARSTAQGGAAC
jgi:hypothetical protein